MVGSLQARQRLQDLPALPASFGWQTNSATTATLSRNLVGMIESADFAETDIPFDFTIPTRAFVSEDFKEDVSACLLLFLRAI